MTHPRSRRSTALTALLAVALALFVVGSRSAGAEDAKGPSYRCTDPSLVYLGNPRLFKKPGVVCADRVYRAIPEYQEILAKNLTDRDVRYHFLMRKASDKFTSAIGTVARDGGYDLMACQGAIVAETADTPPPPDVTDAVISKLPS
jgi:hypothetical protein